MPWEMDLCWKRVTRNNVKRNLKDSCMTLNPPSAVKTTLAGLTASPSGGSGTIGILFAGSDVLAPLFRGNDVLGPLFAGSDAMGLLFAGSDAIGLLFSGSDVIGPSFEEGDALSRLIEGCDVITAVPMSLGWSDVSPITSSSPIFTTPLIMV